MPPEKSISVIIPNYNGRQLLEKNLPPLIDALQMAGVGYEIIVADDASTDDSLTFLSLHYPAINIVASGVNKGFASTANAGIFAASKSLVFLLNSDVCLTGDYFTPLLPYFDKEDTFGVMGRIIGINNDTIQDAAKTQYSTGLKIGANINLVPENASVLWFPTLYLSGANALMDRKKLMLLKGFDELYSPFYGEDLDLSLRAWKLGWKSYYNHMSVCRHPDSVTIKKYHQKSKIKRVVYRNRFVMHEIHLSGYRKVFWYIWIGIQLLGKSIWWQKAFLGGFYDFLKMINRVQHSKKEYKKLTLSQKEEWTNEEVFEFLNDNFKKYPHYIIRH